MTAAKPSPLAAESDLPEGWAVAKLGDICTPPQYGWTTSAQKGKHGLKLLRTSDISDGQVDWGSVPGCADEPENPEKYLLDSRDILVSRAGSVGISYLVKEAPRAIFASYLIRFRALQPISGEFIALFMKSPPYWSAIAEEAAGIAIPNVNASKLKQIEFPLPPLAEQKRIVEKVEQLLARVNAARERLARVPAILKRFRQAVLAAACSGRLTADWREQHSSLEPTELLIAQINQARQSASRNAPGVEVVTVSAEESDEIPQTWCWARFGSLIGQLRNGVSTKPAQKPPGNSILRISSVRSGAVLLDDTRFLPNSDGLVDAYRLLDGDLLFTRYNGSVDLLGVCGMVRGLGERVVLYPDKLMRVRFDHPYVLPAYAEIFFQSPGARDRMTAKSKSSAGQQGISGADVKAQPIALPPLDEQKEIVRRIGALFKLADAIQRRVAGATSRAEKLTQAILAKAFRGELVPTEAELARREGRPYEPASTLLARIHAERNDNASRASSVRSKKR